MTDIKFGTDGWRAVIADDYTFDNVRLVSQSLAEYLKRHELAGRGVAIGYDTRFLSGSFAGATAEVMAGNEIRAWLSDGFVPTPALSLAVREHKAGAGAMITASHNPARWNGFKYKDSTGASSSTELAAQIEKNANEVLSTGGVKRLPLADGLNSGLIAYLDPDPVYFKQLERLVDLEAIRHSHLKVIVDSMYGAGIGYFRELLEGGEIEVIEINGKRNPSFPGIQPEPIAKNLTKLSNTVKEQKADVGLANDGDADRIGIVDEKGNFLNQHQVFALLALYFLEVRGERGAIVETVTDSRMLHILGKLFNVPVYETLVGFKYVAPLMIEKDALIGGEESGGYGFRGHVPERDGILAGLYFLDFIIKTGKTPSQLLDYLFSKVGPHYYDRLDFHVSPGDHKKLTEKLTQRSIDSIAGTKVARLDTTDGYKYCLADDSWLLIRFSGTEPLVRIYAEGHSPEQVQKLLESGRKLLGL